jgi:hypothetical protein
VVLSGQKVFWMLRMSLRVKEWLEVLIGKAFRLRIFRASNCHGSQPNELQQRLGGSAGEHTFREAFHFYRVVKD